MPTNFFFNNFPQNHVTSEQLLVEDLVIESMQIHGMDVFYLPRMSQDQVDMLYGEDPVKQYRKAYALEMYLENVTGMDGEGDFISKFGLEIRDELTLLVSRRRFAATVEQLRPNEGDIIYIPLVQNFFEITFVEHENDQAMFHTLGRGRGGNVYVYALKLKQYVFSEEVIEVGIPEIDFQIRDHYKKTLLPIANTISAPWSTGTFVPDEIVYQGTSLANATAQAIVYSYQPHSELQIIRVKGSFVSGNVTGNTSGTFRGIHSPNDMILLSDEFEDIVDNQRIEDEASGIIDFTESNPFGEP